MSDEVRLEAIRRLLAEAPEGPWFWAQDYGVAPPLQWSLYSGASAADGFWLDGELVTHTTVSFDLVDGRQVPLSERPLWRFLAGSWQAVRDLVRMVDERDAVIADMLEESRHFEAGRRAGLLEAAGRLREEADWRRRNTSTAAHSLLEQLADELAEGGPKRRRNLFP